MNKVTSTFLLTLALITGMLTSCNAKSNKTEEANTTVAPTETPAKPAASTEDPNWKTTPGLYAQITTSKGVIVCKLEPEKAPLTVANFVGLAEGKIPNNAKPAGAPFYDGLTFHRCIPNFMIQGGDPKGNGSGGPGYNFPDEFDPTLRFDGPGVLAMANSGPATNGSQFFITNVATTWLNDKHTIFGHCVEGQAVVDAIKDGEVMTNVKIIRVGDAYKDYDGGKIFAPKLAEFKAKDKEKEAAMEKQKAEFKKQYAAQIDQIVKANAGYQAEWDKKVKAKYPTAKKTASGLYYIIEQQGTGAKAEQFKNVQVHCNGMLWDGTSFYSTKEGAGQPLTFMLGIGKVIPGWDEGLALLNAGAKAKLIIPTYLAYADNPPTPKIPKGSDLVFEVELLGVQ